MYNKLLLYSVQYTLVGKCTVHFCWIVYITHLLGNVQYIIFVKCTVHYCFAVYSTLLLDSVIVVVVVFTLKSALTSIQSFLFVPLQDKETNFRGHKLTQNKVQKKIKIKDPEKVPTLAKKICNGFL